MLIGLVHHSSPQSFATGTSASMTLSSHLVCSIQLAPWSLGPPSASWGNGSRPGCANPRAILGDTDYSQQLRKWSKRGGQRDRALSPRHLRRYPGRPLSTMKKKLGSQRINWSEGTISVICRSLLYTSLNCPFGLLQQILAVNQRSTVRPWISLSN